MHQTCEPISQILSNPNNKMNPPNTWPHVINLSNSIIGVSILAMPFCFHQCGIVLALILLLASALLTQVSCNLLLKAALSCKKRSYEFLALHTFGAPGKLAVEMSIIGLLLGTCIAFYVILGDIGPSVLSKLTGIPNTTSLRTWLLVAVAFGVAMPLCLLRNIESLSNISAASISFYTTFTIWIFLHALPKLWTNSWTPHVFYWRMDGLFRSVSVFSLAFACQTQLFVMYDALPEPSLSRMSSVVNGAVSLCTTIYISVGFFGYVAFCDHEIPGDLLMSLPDTFVNNLFRLFFMISVALSFPLVVFPCRASLHTLFFLQRTGLHGNITGASVIPAGHFNLLTVTIVTFTLVVGIYIPNVEFILALTGATMGTTISFIFPAVAFLAIMSLRSGDSKLIAQLLLFFGVTICMASTYVTVAPIGSQYEHHQHLPGKLMHPSPAFHPVPILKHAHFHREQRTANDTPFDHKSNLKLIKGLTKGNPALVTKTAQQTAKNAKIVPDEKRLEPPVPRAPLDSDKSAASDTKNKVYVPHQAVITTVRSRAATKSANATVPPPALVDKLAQQQQEHKKLLEEYKRLIVELKHHDQQAHADKAKQLEAEKVQHNLQGEQIQHQREQLLQLYRQNSLLQSQNVLLRNQLQSFQNGKREQVVGKVGAKFNGHLQRGQEAKWLLGENLGRGEALPAMVEGGAKQRNPIDDKLRDQPDLLNAESEHAGQQAFPNAVNPHKLQDLPVGQQGRIEDPPIKTGKKAVQPNQAENPRLQDGVNQLGAIQQVAGALGQPDVKEALSNQAALNQQVRQQNIAGNDPVAKQPDAPAGMNPPAGHFAAKNPHDVRNVPNDGAPGHVRANPGDANQQIANVPADVAQLRADQPVGGNLGAANQLDSSPVGQQGQPGNVGADAQNIQPHGMAGVEHAVGNKNQARQKELLRDERYTEQNVRKQPKVVNNRNIDGSLPKDEDQRLRNGQANIPLDARVAHAATTSVVGHGAPVAIPDKIGARQAGDGGGQNLQNNRLAGENNINEHQMGKVGAREQHNPAAGIPLPPAVHANIATTVLDVNLYRVGNVRDPRVRKLIREKIQKDEIKDTDLK